MKSRYNKIFNIVFTFLNVCIFKNPRYIAATWENSSLYILNIFKA